MIIFEVYGEVYAVYIYSFFWGVYGGVYAVYIYIAFQAYFLRWVYGGVSAIFIHIYIYIYTCFYINVKHVT